jgi:hypothetical protein
MKYLATSPFRDIFSSSPSFNSSRPEISKSSDFGGNWRGKLPRNQRFGGKLEGLEGH